jgi:hypothetical protein
MPESAAHAAHRGHRGQHPQDARLFLAPRQLEAIRTAAGELAWLLERGYAMDAALKLVGDRHALRKRQRMALLRSVCAPSRAAARRAGQVPPRAVRGPPLLVDGLNVLITLEVACSGGILLRGNDGAQRLHGARRLAHQPVGAVHGGQVAQGLVASSDGGVLDAGVAWLDLAGAVIAAHVPGAHVLEVPGETG